MRRSGAGVLVLALAMLAGVLATPAASATKSPRWSKIVATLAPGVDPASPNSCNRGGVECLDAVIEEMKRREQPLAERCNHNVVFSHTYRTTTEQFRLGWPRAFADPAYVANLDAIFADYYFDAYDNWKRGRAVPEAWSIAFGAAREKGVTGLGNMLLGINAHISRDLPFVLAEIGLVRADGSSGLDDFTLANAVLVEAQDSALDSVARRFDPDVARVQLPGLAVGEEGFLALFGTWRAESWARAQQLVAAADPAARRAVAREIEAVAATRALLIQAATAYLPVVSSSADRDRYCREHRS